MADGSNETPEIAGFEYIRALGSGAFSDVLLYQQKLPRRKVAVKVLHVDSLDRQTRREFVAEANLMAQLSSHPAIATIYDAAISEAGAPYLVMEYCSGGSLGTSYRSEPKSPAEVLTIGVRLASALEAAHRLGIVHRDVKPANILITDYGTPVLTDFGISIGDDGVAEATMFQGEEFTKTSTTSGSTHGMSVPWAPPEAFLDTPRSDARSDIFSLGATLYSLLEGHTPFELTTASNAAVQLSRRIERGEMTPFAREGTPAGLIAALTTAMATDASNRFASSLEFAQALQAVQRELGLSETPIELPVVDESSVKKKPVDAAAAVAPAAPAPLTPAAVLPPDAPPAPAVPPAVAQPAYVAAAAPPAQQAAGQPDPSLYAAYPETAAPGRKAPVALVAVLTALAVVGVGIGTVAGIGAIVSYATSSAAGDSGTSSDDRDDEDEEDDEPVVVDSEVPLCDDANLDYASEVFGVPVDDIQSLADPGDPIPLESGAEAVCGFQIVDAPDFSSHIIQIVYFEGTEENATAITDAYLDAGFDCEEPSVYDTLTSYGCSGDDYGMSMYLYEESYGDEAPSELSDGPYIDLATYISD